MGTELIVAGVIAAVAAGASVYSANKQANEQRAAMNQAERNARREAEQQREDMRRQNAQQADVSGILQQNATAGGGTTLLTGAGGVNRNDLNLGQGNTLG